jgi:hypothetical protein
MAGDVRCFFDVSVLGPLTLITPALFSHRPPAGREKRELAA